MDYKSQNKEFDDSIKKLFHGTTTMERAAAANHLGYLKDKRATNLFLKALKSEKEPVVINRIIEAMGEIRDSRATMLIIGLLKKEIKLSDDQQDKQRIFLIIESLMKIGDKRALEHIGFLLDSCDNEIRNLATEALECIDANWRENIIKD